MLLPKWYSAVMEYDSRGPTRSHEEQIQDIVGAIDTVISVAIARGQSLHEVRLALMSDDQLLSEEHRSWLSQVVDAAWDARSKARNQAMAVLESVETAPVSSVSRLESCEDALLQSA